MPKIKNLITKEGLEKLKIEYDELKNKKLPKSIERLANARSQGDLTENSEYAAAREELDFIEDRIAEFEKVLRNAKAMDSKTKGNGFIEVGSKVTLKYNGKKIVYFIVSEIESDPIQKKISLQSPIGKALIGKKKGDEVNVLVPAGKIKYQILEIE